MIGVQVRGKIWYQSLSAIRLIYVTQRGVDYLVCRYWLYSFPNKSR